MANKSFPVKSDDDPSLPQGKGEVADSFDPLQTAMSRFIDDFFTSFDLHPLSVFEDTDRFIPKVSIKHDKKSITVTAELRGLQADDIEIILKWDSLIITGGKTKGKEPRTIDFIQGEPHAGCFRKMIPIPFCIESKDVRATFTNGVLQITLPRRTEDHMARFRIPIKKSTSGS